MEYDQVLRMKKLKGQGIIYKAARHNLREFQAKKGEDSHINSLKTSQNVILRGVDSATKVAANAVSLIRQAKLITPVKSNTVLGLEILFSLPPSSGISEQKYFTDSVCWAEGFFKIPILSAVIHNDESAPHCHVIMLPLLDGRMSGSALMGNKLRLIEILDDFHAKVGQMYGLRRGMHEKTYSRAAIASAADGVINELRRSPNKLYDPAIRDALRDTIAKTMPISLMALLGIELPEVKSSNPKTLPEKIADKFKSGKPIDFRRNKPIGLANPQDQTLSCVEVVPRKLLHDSRQTLPRNKLRKGVPRKILQKRKLTALIPQA